MHLLDITFKMKFKNYIICIQFSMFPIIILKVSVLKTID